MTRLTKTILALAAMSVAFALPAQAEVPADSPARLAAIVEKLNALSVEKRKHGTLPRLADADSAELLAAAWDREAILGRGPYRAADLAGMTEIMNSQGALFNTYALFSADPTAQPQMARNDVLFQDELSRSYRMLVATSAVSSVALEDFAAGLKPQQWNKARRDGVAEMRMGLLGVVYGAVLMMKNPALSNANRRLISAALSENAEGLGAAMAVADRAVLIATIAAIATGPGEDDIRGALDKAGATIKAAPCDILCKLP